MRWFQLTLRILGVGIIGVAMIHIVLGPGAEVLFGSGISAISLADPTIDSQNRFYGAAFALYGGVFVLASFDVAKYRAMLILAFTVFFVAGITRIVSGAIVGLPPLPVIALTVIEIIGPPVMYICLQRVTRDPADLART